MPASRPSQPWTRLVPKPVELADEFLGDVGSEIAGIEVEPCNQEARAPRL